VRIGKFGETNKLSIDTIRHYMDLGLILPEKKGGHYFFDERCQSDLELVLNFKGMGFSLNEIKNLFFYKNFGEFTDYEKDAYYQSLFMEKHKEIEQEIKNLTAIKNRLQNKIENLSASSAASSSIIGIDFKVLDLLKCLKCGEKMILQDGRIIRNKIIEGKLTCECEEEYIIDSGILIAGSPSKSAIDLPLDEYILEYIKITDSRYLENLHKGGEWSKRKLLSLNLSGKTLLELGTGVGFFLRSFYHDLPEDCLYIAVDHNLERHRFLKNMLEKSGSNQNILFICADFLDIPIQDSSIDIVIDQSGTSNYSFHHKEFLLHELAHLFKSDSHLAGTFIAFKNFSSKSKIEAPFRHNFIVDKLKKNIRDLHFASLDERASDYMDKGGRYENYFVEGENVFSYSFFGKRLG